MRVIAGECKGRVLVTAPGVQTRPTSDMLKGMIFNMLYNYVEGAVVLDLCAGSGALGIEALSRGGEYAFFIEAEGKALAALESNLHKCRLQERSEVLRGDVIWQLFRFAPKRVIDLVFCDPPYRSELYTPILDCLAQAPWLSERAIIVVEHQSSEKLSERYKQLYRYRSKLYSKSGLSFYRRETSSSSIEGESE